MKRGIPRNEKSERITNVNLKVEIGFPGALDGKESACNVGDWDLIPESGRSFGEGNDNPFQYSCLKNSMGRGAW